MTSSRFDQDPVQPYGHCITCKDAGTETVFASREESREHMGSTFDAGHGHSVRTTNPTRAERIRSYLQSEADDAVDSAIESFIDDVSGLLDTRRDGPDATLAEIRAAVQEVFAEPDWREAWADYVRENYDEDDEEPEPLPEVPHTKLPGMEEL